MKFWAGYEFVMFVGVVKSLATDGGKVIIPCNPVQRNLRSGLFTSPSCFSTLDEQSTLEGR